MKYLTSLFAETFNVPYLIQYLLVVWLPLYLVAVLVEALILEPLWSLRFFRLCRFTGLANAWSMLASLSVKAAFFAAGVTNDQADFYRSVFKFLCLFSVGLLAEVACACCWLHRHNPNLSPRRLWWGLLLAKLVSYLVLWAMLNLLFQSLPTSERTPPRYDFIPKSAH